MRNRQECFVVAASAATLERGERGASAPEFTEDQMERHFEKDLNVVKERLLWMGSLAERAVHQSVHSVLDSDEQLAKRVLDEEDRKSTRLNSSHMSISYAVFCL